jgi:hypothetical protein
MKKSPKGKGIEIKIELGKKPMGKSTKKKPC